MEKDQWPPFPALDIMESDAVYLDELPCRWVDAFRTPGAIDVEDGGSGERGDGSGQREVTTARGSGAMPARARISS